MTKGMWLYRKQIAKVLKKKKVLGYPDLRHKRKKKVESHKWSEAKNTVA